MMATVQTWSGSTWGHTRAPTCHRMGMGRAGSISASATVSNSTTQRLQNVGKKINIAQRRLRDRREMAISNPPSAVKKPVMSGTLDLMGF